MSSLDVDRILAETFVRHVEYRDETSSTNDVAIELVAGGGAPKLPLLAITDRQTRGRGRGTNSWWAAHGALTFTVVIDSVAHDLATQNWPKLSLTVGLAVCEALEQLVSDRGIHLKWPNDVYLERRKVCGILVETVAARPGVVVIGIGINVNNTFQQAPEDVKAIATSLIDETGRSFDLSEVLIRQLRHLEDCIDRVATGVEGLAEAWRGRCMLEGRTVTIDAGNRKITGVCQGIDEEGALLLQTEAGVERCVAGVVTRIL
jgi:BirA family biotin operon repressor/biotin-[acetyl-CoA-carboxylase] ligase